MRLVPIVAMLLAGSACAQSLIDPDRFDSALRSFEPQPGEKALKCDVSPVRPMFTFSFRFQTGYLVQVPMKQYFGKGNSWAIFTRVTPESGGKAAYMGDRVRIPEVPKTKATGDVGGMFLVGEGKYRVEWKLMDNLGRVCRKQWNIEAKRRGNERLAESAMPPGTIAEITLRGAPRPALKPSDTPPLRLTILLHTAPLSPRRTRISVRDRVTLTGALSALIERLPTSSVRMVVFSLDQQKEVFRQDNFSLRAMGQVSRAMSETEQGTVDVKVLANRRGHTEMMANLLNAEINDPNPADVVLVFGPPSRFFDRLPKDAVEKPAAASSPRFFFLKYAAMLRMQPTLSDTIGSAMSKVRGKTVNILTPGDFAKAIDLVERSAAAESTRAK
jgi:hypothetical protein